MPYKTVLPRKQPTQARSARTVQILQQAAALIIEERGPQHYTTNAVAERAGISVGSLYQYFPNKDALTAALILTQHHDMVAELERLVASVQDLSLDATLDRAIDFGLAHALHQPRLAHFLENEENRLPRTEALLQAEERIEALVCAMLRHHLDPGLSEAELTDAAFYTVSIARSLSETGLTRPPGDCARLKQAAKRAMLGYLQPMRHHRAA